MTLRQWLFAVTAAALIAASGPVPAETYPTRPIRLIVPLAPASPADTMSRYIASALSSALGQSVFVVNTVGAGGTLGTIQTARAKPDGYTIAFASQGTLVFNHAIYAKPGYDSLRDLAPIVLIGRASGVLVVRGNHPAATANDIVALAKASPGTLTFSSGGTGSTQHIAGALFGHITGTDLVHIPYRGAAQGVQAVMNGEVTMGFFNTSAVIRAIRDGKLKALGVTSLERLPLLTDVPTLDEQGIGGFDVTPWAGFVAPANTPVQIVQRLNAEITAILARPEIRQQLASQGLDLSRATSASDFARLIADDLALWLPLVKASGAKAD